MIAMSKPEASFILKCNRKGKWMMKYIVVGILIAIVLWGEVQDLVLYRDSGVVDQMFYNGPNLYFRLMDGRVYQGNACKTGMDNGNSMKFTAIDPPKKGQDTITPVIVRCKFISWALGTPLP